MSCHAGQAMAVALRTWLVVAVLAAAGSARAEPPVRLPPGTRTDAQGQLVSGRGLRDTSDFLALERATVKQQAAMILETIGQGVCIVDMEGRLIWANPKMKSYPSDLLSQVCDVCLKRFLKASEQEKGQPAHHRARRFSLTAGFLRIGLVHYNTMGEVERMLAALREIVGE